MATISRKRSLNTPRLLEMQAYRCAVCQTPIHTDHHYDASEWPSMVKIDRDLPRTYDNCVLLCGKCSGRSANYSSLMVFYNAYTNGEVQPNVREYLVNELVLREIREQLTAAGVSPDREVPSQYGKAPMTAVPSIVEGLIRRFEQDDISNTARIRRNFKSARWMTRAYRRKYMEGQNHRCCYCGSRFDTEASSTMAARYPSWEHVENIEGGAIGRMNNLVIACTSCNNLRSIKNMSAYEFAEWVSHHRDEVRLHAEKVDRSLDEARNRKGSSWEPRDRISSKPFYAYS